MIARQVPQPARIQIVEDESIVALDIKLGLEALGFEVTGVASSEAEAIDLAASTAPDLVLMDINLGRGGDGTAAARAIGQRLRVPIVFLTAYSEPEFVERAGLSAPYGYLLKPFELRELNATIRMALARRAEELKTERTERRLRMAMRAASLGVVAYHLDDDRVEGDVAFMNLAEKEGPSFVMGRREFLARLPGREGRSLLRAIERQQATSGTATWVTRDGERIPLEVHAERFDSEGAVIGVLRDISARLLDEARLREAAVVFEAAGCGVAILDGERRVRTVNPAFERLTGWDSSGIEGQPVDVLVHARREGDRPSFADLDVPGNRSGEMTFRRRDGSAFEAWVYLAPVPGPREHAGSYVLTFSDISLLKEAESRVAYLAYHDGLTGLGNRHHLEKCLRQRVTASAAGATERFALLFIDLDGFKTVNDSLGHGAGDRLLVEVARRFEHNLRQSDVPVRLGGDEFVILMGDVRRSAEAALLATKLLAEVQKPTELPGGTVVRVTASIGIAMFPDVADSAEELIRAADSAMYEAKADGRNRYAFFTPSMATRASERLRLEQGLRAAALGTELLLHWQPVVDLGSGRPVGVEGLLRWTHPEHGPIGPDRFIPVAEGTGIIVEIGDWVLNEACRQARAWLDAGVEIGRVAINVSAVQLQDVRFAERVERALVSHALPPRMLELELTESVMQDREHGPRMLRELRHIGVGLALDDFGTGFSSLSLLESLPLDRIKIDRSFIRGLASEGSALDITRTICEIASFLGFAVTAEGVENERQRELLLQIGVRQAQGWLFSPAIPADGIRDFLARQGGG